MSSTICIIQPGPLWGYVLSSVIRERRPTPPANHHRSKTDRRGPLTEDAEQASQIRDGETRSNANDTDQKYRPTTQNQNLEQSPKVTIQPSRTRDQACNQKNANMEQSPRLTNQTLSPTPQLKTVNHGPELKDH